MNHYRLSFLSIAGVEKSSKLKTINLLPVFKHLNIFHVGNVSSGQRTLFTVASLRFMSLRNSETTSQQRGTVFFKA